MPGFICLFDELQIAFETSFEWTRFDLSSVRQIVYTTRRTEETLGRLSWELESILLSHMQSHVQRSFAAAHANSRECENVRMFDVRLIFLAKVTIDRSPENSFRRTSVPMSGECAMPMAHTHTQSFFVLYKFCLIYPPLKLRRSAGMHLPIRVY